MDHRRQRGLQRGAFRLVQRIQGATDGPFAGATDAGDPILRQRREPQAGGPTVERVGRALNEAGPGELFDQGADRVGGNAKLGGGVLHADARMTFEQAQKLKDGDPQSPTYGQIVDEWTSSHFVTVRALAREFGGSGVAEYVIDPGYSARDLEYLKRCGLDPKDVMRPPRSGDWHGFLDGNLAEGQRRVIVNLDTLEYIDPVKFGQPSTLAGIVRQASKDRCLPILKKAAKDNDTLVDVAGGLFAMLCHPQRRGGGDLPASAEELSAALWGNPHDPRMKHARLFAGCEDIKGRWRGGHILGTRQFEPAADWNWPTTEEVIEKGTDVSDRVIKYLVALSHY